MLELARCFGDAPVVMADLAEREGLSRKYLHTLLTGLRAAGLARSVRGAGGGFVLARDPSEINLKDVLRALEGSLCLVDCVEDERVCDRANGCTARGVWQELSGVIESMLDNTTLADVIATETERKPRASVAGSNPCGTRSGSLSRKAGKR
jgi:Rrf2 family cysteine metabolism transcriptional repressor